jgi:hypothetical protein
MHSSEVARGEKVTGLEAVITRGENRRYYFPTAHAYLKDPNKIPKANVEVSFGDKVVLSSSLRHFFTGKISQECHVTLTWETFDEILRMYGKERRGRELMLELVSSNER